ncbi:hypothetical protein [Bacillus sp. UNC41MFS5]|uniref:hypothetical protein n=1 Tax=Bacillus sp. UNC41MFS5 TaxID=1449046 RepID=UPI00047B538F|nr:hypothetical protein [Bacillus sp. UNC41MFS5]
MSIEHFHGLCNRHMGRAVEIRTHDGRIHRGIIHRVSNDRVFLQPIGRPRNLGGFGYGGWGWGWGAGIALGFIASLAVISLFFW